MAAKRAGLIEAPQARTLQAPNLGNETSPLVAKAYDDLARTADTIGRALLPAVDNATADRATKQVAQGNFERTGGFTRQDEIYDKVIDAGFMANAANTVDGYITKLESDHLTTLDGEKFAAENAALKDGYLKEMDTRYAVPLAQLWDKQASAAAQRINGLATQRAATKAVESLKARQQLLLDRVSGASDPNDEQVASALSELDSVLNARSANPLDNLTSEDAIQIRENALSKMSANRISDEAMALFDGGGRTDAAYTEAAKLLDDAIASPDLALSRTERSSYLGAARSALNAARSEARREERELAAQLRDAQTRASAAFSVEYGDANMRAGEGYAPDAAEIAELHLKLTRRGAFATPPTTADDLAGDNSEHFGGSDSERALRDRIAELEARGPEIRIVEVEKIVERIVEAPAPPEPTDGIPDAFRGLMLPDETPEKFTRRMQERWQYLKHMQIDGAKPTASRALPDMTEEERRELTDLERRNGAAKWLD